MKQRKGCGMSCGVGEATKYLKMSCDVGEAIYGLENEAEATEGL